MKLKCRVCGGMEGETTRQELGLRPGDWAICPECNAEMQMLSHIDEPAFLTRLHVCNCGDRNN